MTAGLRARTTWKAIGLLRRRLGVRATAGLLWRVARRQRRGEPWADQPAPASDREVACREQIGGVALIYDELLGVIDEPDALALVGDIVRAGALLQLRDAVPAIDRAEYQALAPDEQEALLTDIVSRFPNATIDRIEASATHFRYTISACQFVDLAHRLGKPQLARLFCAADGLFFERDMDDVVFERPHTLASGGTCCDFRFHWRDDR